MSWIFIDKEKEGEGEMRQQMRRSMRGGSGYRNYGGYRDDYEHGYRRGYKSGYEDGADDENEEYRRHRDSRGRYI